MNGKGSPRERFAVRLAARALLADGGMGTLLFSRGIPQRACLDELAATRPDLVGAMHREYLDAGAELIETLTFGANRLRLDTFGLAPEAGRFNRRAAQVAREARDVSGRDARVSLRVIDRTGTIVSPEYSVDSAKDWQAFLPSDTIWDSPEETASFTAAGLPAGPHQIAVRATDSAGNVAYENVYVTVK